jgi:hypothetical protein
MVCLAVVAHRLGSSDVDTALVLAVAKRRGVSAAAFEGTFHSDPSLGPDPGERLALLLASPGDGDGDDGARLALHHHAAPAAAAAATVAPAGNARLPMNQQNLRRAWDVSQCTRAEDWSEWLRRFSVELLRESPSPALRACFALAQIIR